jgi:DNA-binding LacI/PurR family transcriptional regulator
MASRYPTIQEVAAKAEVSEATVSRVVRGQTHHIRAETRQRVLQVASEMGYQPNLAASALRTSRTYTVALIIPDITNPIWPVVARGVQQTARLEGYSVVLANTDWDEGTEHDYVAMARRAQMDGILINPAHVTNTELRNTAIPSVILGAHSEFPDFDIVGIDIEQGVVSAVQHLYQLGHRRIALIVAPLTLMSARKRRRGYLQGLDACGLPARDDYIVEAPYTRDGGREALARLWALPERPTAIFASNDQQAIGALTSAQVQAIHVPGDLSLVGLDDIDAASVTNPPLTTLRRSQREYGAAAMQFLLERIEGRGPALPRRRLYPCELIVRGTTAPPKRE